MGVAQVPVSDPKKAVFTRFKWKIFFPVRCCVSPLIRYLKPSMLYHFLFKFWENMQYFRFCECPKFRANLSWYRLPAEENSSPCSIPSTCAETMRVRLFVVTCSVHSRQCLNKSIYIAVFIKLYWCKRNSISDLTPDLSTLG